MKLTKYYILTFITLLACLVTSSLQAVTSVTAGDMVITSKLMTMFRNIFVARGGVKATNGETTMTADRGIYDQDLAVVKAIDNVRVEQPDTLLTSDYLEAYVNEDRILARGNPKVVRIMIRERKDKDTGEVKQRKSKIILTCNEVEGFQREDRILAKGDVRLIEVAYRDGETEEEAAENEKKPISDLRCEILEMFSSEDKAIARNKVEVFSESLTATGDKAIYLNKEGRMIIVGHAHARQTSEEDGKEQVSEVFANKIVYYPDDERSIAVGNVHATVYPGSSKKKDEDKDTKKKKKKNDEDNSESENSDEDDLELDDDESSEKEDSLDENSTDDLDEDNEE